MIGPLLVAFVAGMTVLSGVADDKPILVLLGCAFFLIAVAIAYR